MKKINTITPFKGYRFNPEQTDLEKAAAPPYDVYDYGDSTDTTLRSVPYNTAHFDKPLPKDDSRYGNAAKIFNAHIASRNIVQDESEYFYIYRQTWQNTSRTGIFGGVDIDPSYRKIKKHEKIKQGPIADRLMLMENTGFFFSPIFCVFQSSSELTETLKDVQQNRPEFAFEYPSGIYNELWISGNSRIRDLLETRILYIADGHHRYQTMIEYLNKHPEETTLSALIFLVPDDEVSILPYNRFFRIKDNDLLNNLEAAASLYFSIEQADRDHTHRDGTFILSFNNRLLRLTPKDTSHKYNSDIEMIHALFVEPVLKISEQDLKDSGTVKYAPGDRPVPELVKIHCTGGFNTGIFPAPVKFSQLIETADLGLTMPRKSTFFYPKVPSGIVFKKISY